MRDADHVGAQPVALPVEIDGARSYCLPTPSISCGAKRRQLHAVVGRQASVVTRFQLLVLE
jgi:hypothetical protein